MPTLVYQDADGQLLEYRRHPYDPDTLHVEARPTADGTPHADESYPIGEKRWSWLDTVGSGILEALGDLIRLLQNNCALLCPFYLAQKYIEQSPERRELLESV
jgi:hypothetical protein